MKRKVLWILSLSCVLALSGCGQQQSQNDKPSEPPKQVEQKDGQEEKKNESEAQNKASFDFSTTQGVQDFTKAIKKANREVESVRLDLDGDYDFFGNVIHSELESIVFYEPGSQNPKSYYIKGKGQDSKDNNQGEVVFQAPSERYRRANEGQWSAFPNAEPDRIDFHGFVKILEDVLEDEKYEIKENGNYYDVVITDKSFDFVKAFHGQMNFSFEDVAVNEINRNIVFQIDKESLLLDTVKVDLKYDAPSGKKLDVDAKVEMSEWNEADGRVIENALKQARGK